MSRVVSYTLTLCKIFTHQAFQKAPSHGQGEPARPTVYPGPRPGKPANVSCSDFPVPVVDHCEMGSVGRQGNGRGRAVRSSTSPGRFPGIAARRGRTAPGNRLAVLLWKADQEVSKGRVGSERRSQPRV